MMIGKWKKLIISFTGGFILDIKREDIELYLTEVKKAVRKNRYRLAVNQKRQDNRNLFLTYVIDEQMAKEILLDLEAEDFSQILQNEHAGYEEEQLYVFGKDVTLLERMGNMEKEVSLYIKFNKLVNQYVIVISFHEQKYPLRYYFKQSGKEKQEGEEHEREK